ncbi:MAG: type VI secretion system tip protein VgrG [bacterium]
MINLDISNTVLDRPAFEVLADGAPLRDQVAVHSVTLSKSVNRIPTAKVVIEDGSIPEQDFSASNMDELIPGVEMEIKMGYRDELETVFKGIIIRHGIKTRKNARALLTLELKDIAIKMTVGRKNKYYKDVTDSDIIEEILDAYGVEKDIAATTVNHPEMVQFYCTDWDFMVTRAEASGQLVFSDDGKITTKAPDLSASPVLTLVYGQNIVEFNTEIDARDQYTGMTSNSWDMGQQEVITSEASDPGIPEQGNLSNNDLADVLAVQDAPFVHGGRISSEELQSWADARFMRSKLSKIKGRIRINGFNGVKPGDVVELQGMGDRFNGIAFVSSVGHHYGPGIPWYTDLEIGLSQEWLIEIFDNVMAKPSSSLLPGVHGLQIGIVTAIHDDPDGEDRIQVRLPVIDPGNEGVWARVATLDAGENRGSFFRPEVDDEVIVGFLSDDPRYPVVLGMMNSSAKPAPLSAEEENKQKGFITREELKLLFDDDKKSVTIVTPNGNTVVLSDDEGSIVMEDENGNKTTMDSSGITIESASDINIKATGDINIEGVNINGKASANFKAEGSAGAELSTSAVAVVKGSLVQIN